MREAVVVAAPGKLNLRLRVLAREESGFHQLETIFLGISLADRVRVERGGDGIVLELEGAELGAPEENISHRAAEVFYRATELEPAVGIEIEKRIPVGGGLGGGSSDAAATLRALNRLYGEPLDRERLLEVGSGLGSDVAFFLTPTPFALAWGRGERLLSLPPLGSAPVLVAVPGPELPTVESYRLLAEDREAAGIRPGGHAFSLEALRDWDGVVGLVANDFEEAVYREHPHLERIREGFEGTGPRFTLLAGSGSSVYAVYRGERQLEEAHETMSHRFPGTVFMPAQTLTSVPPVTVE